MYAHDLRTPTNPREPEPVGVCDRCYRKWRLVDLRWQYDYRGNALTNLRIRVCPDDYDEPFNHNRPIIITGIEGYVPDARPPDYDANAAGPPQPNVFIIGESILGGPDVLGP